MQTQLPGSLNLGKHRARGGGWGVWKESVDHLCEELAGTWLNGLTHACAHREIVSSVRVCGFFSLAMLQQPCQLSNPDICFPTI